MRDTGPTHILLYTLSVWSTWYQNVAFTDSVPSFYDCSRVIQTVSLPSLACDWKWCHHFSWFNESYFLPRGCNAIILSLLSSLPLIQSSTMTFSIFSKIFLHDEQGIKWIEVDNWSLFCKTVSTHYRWVVSKFKNEKKRKSTCWSSENRTFFINSRTENRIVLAFSPKRFVAHNTPTQRRAAAPPDHSDWFSVSCLSPVAGTTNCRSQCFSRIQKSDSLN